MAYARAHRPSVSEAWITMRQGDYSARILLLPRRFPSTTWSKLGALGQATAGSTAVLLDAARRSAAPPPAPIRLLRRRAMREVGDGMEGKDRGGIRHRTVHSKGCLSNNKTALAMLFKLAEAAE
jgi:hypothetical protein